MPSEFSARITRPSVNSLVKIEMRLYIFTSARYLLERTETAEVGSMGFSPLEVGLSNGGGISARFGEIRENNCPHKGLDIRSSGIPTPFTAGIYGTVVFTGGSYGTIAVRPRDGSAIWVQYLHCSKFLVSKGDNVYPWTVLGHTGAVAPAGTNISGVHLHIQVQVPGAGLDCWNTQSGTRRNFIDPQTYFIKNYLSGTWQLTNTFFAGGGTFTDRDEVRIGGALVGMPILQQRQRNLVIHSNGCQIGAEFFWNHRITGFSGQKINFRSPQGSASTTHDSCNLNWGDPTAHAGSGDLELLDDNRIRYLNGTMHRIGLSDSLDNNVSSIFDVAEGSEKSFTNARISFEVPSNKIDIASTDPDWLSGASPSEIY